MWFAVPRQLGLENRKPQTAGKQPLHYSDKVFINFPAQEEPPLLQNCLPWTTALLQPAVQKLISDSPHRCRELMRRIRVESSQLFLSVKDSVVDRNCRSDTITNT